MATIKMFAPVGVTGTVYGNFSGAVTIGADGTAAVDGRDANALISAGWTEAIFGVTMYTTPIAVPTASANTSVSSVTMTNGGLTIANQPTVARPIQFIVGAGTVAITAGQLAVNYVGIDGLATTDNLGLSTAASGTSTINLTKSVISLTNATVTGLTGGASPYIYGGTTATIGVPMPPSGASLAILMELDTTSLQSTLGVPVAGVLGGVTPHNAPNATQTYSLWYSYLSPWGA